MPAGCRRSSDGAPLNFWGDCAFYYIEVRK
jgi:hypothetical protein